MNKTEVKKIIDSLKGQEEIAIDIFPIVEKNNNGFFSSEVASGEVIYTRGR